MMSMDQTFIILTNPSSTYDNFVHFDNEIVYVLLCLFFYDFFFFRDAIKGCINDDNNEDILSRLSTWRDMVNNFITIQMRSVKKSFANIKSKPNSRVAALVEEVTKKQFLNSLIPSNGTLIVVPSVLLEHWKVRS
jgi:hypothetical protein